MAKRFTVTTHGEPDALDRQRYTTQWRDDGVRGGVRGQVSFGSVAAFVESAKRRGYRVTVRAEVRS